MKIKEIEISLIDQDSQLIRETPDDDTIGELAEDMAAEGLEQPIGAALKPDGRYQLLWGDRRRRAALRLGWTKINAHLKDYDPTAVKTTALRENIFQEKMKLSEEIATVRYLAEDQDFGVEKISARLHKSRSWVLTRLMADNLPTWIREPLMEGVLPIGHAEMIAAYPDESMQRYFVAQVIQQRWNKSELRLMIEANSVPGVAHPATATNIPGINPLAPNKPLLYRVECCDTQEPIENTTLLRVHANGHGCRADADRPDHASHPEHGMERHTDPSGRDQDRRNDRTPEPETGLDLPLDLPKATPVDD